MLFKQIIAIFISLFVLFGAETLCSASTSVSGMAAEETLPLPADQAFAFSISLDQSRQVIATWRIAPGYYLYQQRFHITTEPNRVVSVAYPDGNWKSNANGGRDEVYAGLLNLPITLHGQNTMLRLNMVYQGCSEGGFCYPPIYKSFSLNLTKQIITPYDAKIHAPSSIASLSTDQNQIKSMLTRQQFGVVLWIFLGFGLLLAFTPCVFPMIPILTSIIVGQKQVTTMKSFLLSGSYVLGSAMTYAIAGLISAWVGYSLQAWLQQTWVILLTSLMFVLLACSQFEYLRLPLPRRWQNGLTSLSQRQQGGHYLDVFLMGMISTLLISPCVTAPLVGVLMFISQTGNLLLGTGALFTLGLGMGIPLLFIGISAGKWLPKTGSWMVITKKILGFFMLAMAIWWISPLILPHLQRKQITSLSSWTIVNNMTALNQQLAAARIAHRPTLVDFYATWCESCVAMDKKVFSQTVVQQALKPFVLVRADLSTNDVAAETLLKESHVIAPPTILFFNTNGQEMNSQRIIGEIDVNEFLARLQRFHSILQAQV